MHGVDKVNFSHNVVGKRPRVTSGSASGSSELDLSGSAAVVTPDLPSHVIVDSYTEGIEVCMCGVCRCVCVCEFVGRYVHICIFEERTFKNRFRVALKSMETRKSQLCTCPLHVG